MKKFILAQLTIVSLAAALQAEQVKIPPLPPKVEVPPPVTLVAAEPVATAPVYVYDQKPLQGMPQLIAPPQAEGIIEQFKSNFSKIGGQRFLVYVNRELMEEPALKLTSRNEHIETTRTSSNAAGSTNTTENTTTHTVAQNNYHHTSKTEVTLADRQTVRDVERLVGRPLRSAGASLVDQHVATRAVHPHGLDSLNAQTDQAREDRENLSQVADAVIEVLMSSRNVTVPEVSGDKIYTVPDIQMTAIRLKDAKIIGQASAADVMNRAGNPGFVARNFDVQAVTEATTIALMGDMLVETR